MTLEEYLDRLPDAGAREKFAVKVDRNLAYLWHVAKGRRKASASLAIAIERETGGQVSCETTCPDADWDYIRATIQKKDSAA